MDVDMHPSPQVLIMGRGGGIGRRFIDLDPEAVLLKRIHALEFSANSCETWAQSTFGDPVRTLSSVPALLVIIVQLLLQLPSVSPRPASLASWHPAFDLAVASLRRSQDNNK